MDAQAQDRLSGFIRKTVAVDLDQLQVEVDELRKTVALLERLLGLPGEPPARRRRQQLVRELTARGYSQRSIATMVRANRATVAVDCLRLGIEPAPFVVASDGRVVPSRHAPR